MKKSIFHVFFWLLRRKMESKKVRVERWYELCKIIRLMWGLGEKKNENEHEYAGGGFALNKGFLVFSSFTRIRGTFVHGRYEKKPNIFCIYTFFARGFCGKRVYVVGSEWGEKRVKCGFSEENTRFLGGKSHFIKYLTFGNERNIHTKQTNTQSHILASSHIICTAFAFLQSNRRKRMKNNIYLGSCKKVRLVSEYRGWNWGSLRSFNSSWARKWMQA